MAEEIRKNLDVTVYTTVGPYPVDYLALIDVFGRLETIEIMKKGMVNLDAAFKKKKLGAQMLLQIHDELLITVPKKQNTEIQQVVQNILESVVDWKVPLKVSLRSGASWKEVTK